MNGNSEVDLQPDLSVVLQEEEPEETAAIPVCVRDIHGPVRTQELPRKAASTRTLSIGTTPVRILRADHYRASAVITAFDQDIYIAFSEAAAQDTSSSARWTAVVPYVSTAVTDVWVRSYTSTTELSYVTERWATGD